MTKLQNIKRIVNTYGSFTIADLEGDPSPLINSMGKDNFQLAESFYDKGGSTDLKLIIWQKNKK